MVERGSTVKVTRLGWFGTRTDRFDETTAFFRDDLGLALVRRDRGFAMFRLPGATNDLVEVFGTDDGSRSFQGTEGAVGFVVDDVEAARAELESAGIEPIDPVT